MGRFKTIAGHFKEVMQKQPIKIKQNVHAIDPTTGKPKFLEDEVTPLIEEIEVDAYVDVKNRIWIEQVNIPFTPEEETARDAEEVLHANEKLRPVALTTEQELNLLLEEGADAVKAKRAEHAKAMEAWSDTHKPLIEDFVTKVNAINRAAQKPTQPVEEVATNATEEV